MAVVKWKFEDVWETGTSPYTYIFGINPNAGGSPTAEKNFNIAQNAGPNRGSVIQEGQMSAPKISFGGSILTQAQYETLEFWYTKRILLDLTDDLGRVFRGVFSAWSPTRVRRASNFWYHTYTAEFLIFAYRNASGAEIYGRFEA